MPSYSGESLRIGGEAARRRGVNGNTLLGRFVSPMGSRRFAINTSAQPMFSH